MTTDALAAAIASLPGASPRRIRALVAAAPLVAVWGALLRGKAADLPGMREALGADIRDVAQRWKVAARAVDLDRLTRDLERVGARPLVLGSSTYPPRLVADPEPPGILFVAASSFAAVEQVSTRPTVAIVGTRRCTNYGASVAADLGRMLSERGVCVVSGLALGIDGAAHEGALAGQCPTEPAPSSGGGPLTPAPSFGGGPLTPAPSLGGGPLTPAPSLGGGPLTPAPPVAVVGSGLDVVYPRRHRKLWERVVAAGAVLSEAPLGASAEPWRFPLRNRIIAGLADLVVVVESHAAGGSMHTVQSAIDRGVPVMAVPGSVRSPSSAGTNRLLADGVAPVLDVDDILVALSLDTSSRGGDERSTAMTVDESSLDPELRKVLAAVDWTPTRTEEVLRRTGLGLGAAAAALMRLEMAQMVRSHQGWWERHGEVR